MNARISLAKQTGRLLFLLPNPFFQAIQVCNLFASLASRERKFMFQNLDVDEIRRIRKEIQELSCMVTIDVNRAASVLRSCGNANALEEGKDIHHFIIQSGLEQDRFLGNFLVQMYGKCGALHEAEEVFENIPNKNTFSWNMMIAAYAHNGQLKNAHQLFEQVPQPNVVSWNEMITAYTQHGQLNQAIALFKKMPHKDVISWNALIAGYAEHGDFDNAFGLFQQMPCRDNISWNTMIVACARQGNMKQAISLFKQMPDPDVVTCNAMIGVYAQQGQVEEAYRMFHSIPQKNVTTWTAMVSAYAKNGRLQQALQLFHQTPHRDVFAWNDIISAFADNGKLEEALHLFQEMPRRNVVSWTIMISAHAEQGKVEEAFSFFQQMPERNVVSWTAMVSAFARQGLLNEAMELFIEMPQKNMVSWTALISGYGQQGQLKEAFHLFQQMQTEGFSPDNITIMSIIDACSNHAALAEARVIDTWIRNSIFKSDILLGTSLVNMYGRCGSIPDAVEVFNRMPQHSLLSWNSLIGVYAQHGCGQEAFQALSSMMLEGVMPCNITFVSIISACRHSGMVNEAHHFLVSMSPEYQITRTLEHYNCTADILGRAGQADVAEVLLKNMLPLPDTTSWTSLLNNSCSVSSVMHT